MRFFLLLLMGAGVGFAGDGIAWTGDVPRTLDRALRNNQPVLVAINALDEEVGNRTMAFERYRDRALIDASRPFLCLVASPNDHERDGLCRRFGAIACSKHKEVMTWASVRLGQDGSLVSPGHFILAPDGSVMWRQPYWIEAHVLARQLERALLKVSPRATLQLAANTREPQMEKLAQGGNPGAYLASGDPLAPAVLLLLYEDEEDGKWLAPLKRAPREAFGLLRLFLQDDKAVLPAALGVDPARAKWWAQYHNASAPKPPAPHDPKLAAAWSKLQKKDDSGLEPLLGALAHPVDGPEVRFALKSLTGEDFGTDAARWREGLKR